MDIRKIDAAVVFIDPQNDVLSGKGANWGPSARASTRTAHSRIWSASSRPQRRLAIRYLSRLNQRKYCKLPFASGLADVDFGVVRASFAVAETGSELLSDADLHVDAVAYLAQHLIVLLDPADIVVNLHQAPFSARTP